MLIELQFYTLSGEFKRTKTEVFKNSTEALNAVKAYAEPQGYTNIKLVDGDGPDEGLRFTGRTPGGRNGRNIALGDWVLGEGEDFYAP